jgi:hypothetical protein
LLRCPFSTGLEWYLGFIYFCSHLQLQSVLHSSCNCRDNFPSWFPPWRILCMFVLTTDPSKLHTSRHYCRSLDTLKWNSNITGSKLFGGFQFLFNTCVHILWGLYRWCYSLCHLRQVLQVLRFPLIMTALWGLWMPWILSMISECVCLGAVHLVQTWTVSVLYVKRKTVRSYVPKQQLIRF